MRQGIDLLDFWRGQITPRRMRVLLEHLPADALTLRKVHPKDAAIESWNVTDYLLARLIDMFGVANFKAYTPVTRPGEVFEARAEADRVAAFLQAQAERNRQREAEARKASMTPAKTRRS